MPRQAQQRKYLPGLCKGTLVGALGLTEPGAGSDALGSMRTTAQRDGDHYVLNGSKLYITNGPDRRRDPHLCQDQPGTSGPHGISAFIVEKDFPGFAVAQKLIKMGLRGSPTGELVFDDCRVPVENLVGDEDGGVADHDERTRPRALHGELLLPGRGASAASSWRSTMRARASSSARRSANSRWSSR